MDPDEFARAVEAALSHLYDQPFLQTHARGSLALLAGGSSGEARCHALQRRLLDAIQALKPSVRLPYSSLAWRKYRYLFLRYVEGLEPTQVAEELGVSVRQSYRYHQEGLAALVSMLADLRKEAAPRRQDTPPEPAPSALEREEVARLGAALRWSLIELGEVVESALATVAPLACSRGIRVSSASKRWPRVVTERSCLRQALLNLLVLCVEHSAESVEVAAHRDSHGLRLSLHVATMSEPLELDLARTETFRVAEQLLRMQGLGVSIEAGRQQGFAFHVGLDGARPPRVLVIDDNQDVVQLFRRYLSDRPCEVLAAASGEDALRSATVDRPAVITLDLMMPGQDGWQTLQLLRNRPETRDIPVIVCSVLHQRDLALLLGASDFLAKPVSRETLRNALEPHWPAAAVAGCPGYFAGSPSAHLPSDLAPG